MTTLAVTDPVTGAPHNARLKTATADPIPESPQETYAQLRERFLLRWCREKKSQGWCGTFDNIMVADLGYTAKEVLEARARFDYRHAATTTFTSNHEIDKTEAKALTDRVRRYLRDYFEIENTSAATATMEMVSPPEPEPEMTEFQREKARVLKTILDNRFTGPATESAILHALGYTHAEIEAAHTAGRWVYRMSLNWHCQHQIRYPTDTRRHITDHITNFDRGYIVTDVELTPGTIQELN